LVRVKPGLRISGAERSFWPDFATSIREPLSQKSWDFMTRKNNRRDAKGVCELKENQNRQKKRRKTWLRLKTKN
jgi:hypothetical protein